MFRLDSANPYLALKSYVGFFSILWFTWLQVALFDVRFSNDSAFERLCKAIQFGIMVGFAVVGPAYSTERESNSDGTLSTSEIEANSLHLTTFGTLSLILMVSRIVLALQYCVALLWTHKYKKAIVPLCIHVATLWISAMAFLGLYFSFRGNPVVFNTHGIIGWYIIIGVEAFIILLVSGRWKFLSFRKTPLVERLGLLTLIILGEGIIGLCNSIRKVETDNNFPPNVIGQIICSVLIIYFIWMLYFDQIETERVGTLRQQIWTMLHFPFHVCVLLVVEGISQIAVWTKVNDVWVPQYYAIVDQIYNRSAPLVNGSYALITNPNLQAVSDYYNFNLTNLFPDPLYYPVDITENLGNLTTYNTTDPLYQDAASKIVYDVINYIFLNFDIKVPKSADQSEAGQTAAFFVIFQTVYLYLFMCAGFLLLFLATLFWLGKRRKTRGEFLSIALRIVIGIGISLLAVLYAPSLRNNSLDAFDTFFSSSWMLPTIVFAYLFGKFSPILGI